ncbi:DUF2780 domain-containing protein [Nitrosococcus watsonii]|uniref:DUF2780 domain-containing protein n=1 Tax=Nitrosococcus watsoni (strain C-113) TaxID=105559 RepID=D8K798_NITWC|nr:DUF2780 domain-containing protein [Nitrosococcus watsonii]ADJ28775.1 conserved hypothetical protein [Nitrosococcus watsonii C-113]
MRIIDCIKIGILILILLGMGCATKGGEENVASSVDSGLATVEQAAQGGRQAIESGTTAAKNMENQANLADILVNQLGVSEQQAMGGAGAIFQEAKNNMKPQEFTTLSQSVPGMSDMLNAAPNVSGSAPGMATSGLSSMMGDANNALGSMTSLASSFQQLNLSPDMVSQFVPVVTNYVRNTGGQAVANLLRSALGAP